MKKRYYVLLLVVIVIVAHLKYLLTNNPMIFYGDNIQQLLPFYYHGWDLAHSGSLYLWDWTHGLGASIFSHVYYFITSPFFWLSTLFPRDWMPQLFLYLYLLKMCLMAVFSFLWLTQLNKNHTVSFIGAIALTFSGWVLTYYHYFFFLDAFLLYPLVLYSIEKYMKERKMILMVLSIALVTVVNFYFSYSLIPFAMLYSLFRNSLKYRGKEIIIEQLKVIGIYLIGIGIAGVILIPSAIIILQTPRLGDSNTELFSIVTIKQLYRFLTSIFVPVGHRFDPNFLISLSNDPGIGWGGGASLYTSLLVPLCVPLILFIKDKREKICYIVFGALLSFFMIFKIFYFLFQGSMETRWFYMFTFLFIIIFTRFLDLYLEEKSEIQTKGIQLSLITMGVVTIAIIWGLLFVTYKKGWNVKPNELLWLRDNAVVSTFFVIGYMSLLLANKFKYRQIGIALILVIECLLAFHNLLSIDPPLSMQDVEYAQVEKASVFEELKGLDNSFYRVEFNGNGLSDSNLPMSSNFNGFRFYSSVFQYSQNDFLSQLKEAAWATTRQLGKENILNMLSYKYFIDFAGDMYPPYGFEYFTEIQGYKVYVNKHHSSLGFTFDRVISESEYNSKTPLEKNLLHPNYLVVPDEYKTENVINEDLLTSFETVLYNEMPGYYEFSFDEVKQETMVYVENFGSPKLNVVAYLDDMIVYEQAGYQFDFAGFYVESPFNRLEVSVEQIDDTLGLLNVYLDSNLSRYEDVYAQRDVESMSVDEFNNDKLIGSITINDKAKWVFTSIPYDKGWTVRVNGEKIEPVKVNQGFIGMYLEAGSYNIEFDYYPRGLNIGIILSLGSLVTFVLVLRKQKQKMK